MKLFQKLCRWFSPQLYIHWEIARLERAQGRLHLTTMSADKRHEQSERVHDDLCQLYEWQLTFTDKALLKRAAKIGVYLEEIEFENTPDSNNIGRYHCLGSFGDEHLRDNFRASLQKAVRAREPSYRKERLEQVELVVKIIAALTAAATGIIGALIGLFAVRR